MKQSKANQAMLKRLLVAVVLMFGFTYAMVLFYFKAADETAANQARLPAAPASAAEKARPGPVPASGLAAGQGQRQGTGRTD